MNSVFEGRNVKKILLTIGILAPVSGILYIVAVYYFTDLLDTLPYNQRILVFVPGIAQIILGFFLYYLGKYKFTNHGSFDGMISMDENSLTEKEFDMKRKINETRSKRNLALGSALFLLLIAATIIYSVYDAMKTFQLVTTLVFLSIILMAFLYDAYTKHKVLKELKFN